MPAHILRFRSLRAAGDGADLLAGAVVFDARDGAPTLGRDPTGLREESQRYVRISLLGDPDCARQLASAVESGARGVLLSGAQGLRELEQLSARLAVAEAEEGLDNGLLRIVPCIDGAAGVLALATLAPHPRLAGLLCDATTLASALACGPDAPAIAQARGLTVLTAAACGVPAVLLADDVTVEAAGREGFAALAEAAEKAL